MDTRRALLDAHVAEAAEAWLTDPRDAGVYARLVAAVEERRRHLRSAGSVEPADSAAPLHHLRVDHWGTDARGDGAADDDADDEGSDPRGDGAADDHADDEGSDPRGEGAAVDRADDEGSDPRGDGAADDHADDQGSDPRGDDAAVDHEDDQGSDDLGPEPSWPAVRSVGADLVGDPAAVLRRLRGG